MRIDEQNNIKQIQYKQQLLAILALVPLKLSFVNGKLRNEDIDWSVIFMHLCKSSKSNCLQLSAIQCTTLSLIRSILPARNSRSLARWRMVFSRSVCKIQIKHIQ